MRSVSSRGRPSRTAIYARLADEVAQLRARYGGLPSPEEAEDIWREIWYAEAHSSTAIEGNTLVLREVETLLREGRAVGDKQLKDYLEVRGYAEAAQWVYSHAILPGEWNDGNLLTLTEIRYVHRMAMMPVWEVSPHPYATDHESPGNFRQHNIEPFPGGMIPPDFTEVQPLMTDWVASVNAVRSNTAPIAEALGMRHAAFERIHPFLDGNGRTGRLLLNLMLVRLGYPPAIIHKKHRTHYLKALDAADNGDPGPLGEILARAVIENLMRFILPAVAGRVKLVPLEVLVTKDLSINGLKRAIERGRLRAVRDAGGRLLSSRQWVEDYYRQRYHRLKLSSATTGYSSTTEPSVGADR